MVVVMETLEARNELGEGANLPHVIHEPLRELLQDGIFWSAFHWTSLEKKVKKIQETVSKIIFRHPTLEALAVPLDNFF